jgi:pimeloyl-ACP methyl ester carboxylesterase
MATLGALRRATAFIVMKPADIFAGVQFIAGRRDMVVPPVNAEYLHERLPHSELHLVDSGPFVWEDAADDYAALVNAWWADG